MDRNRAALIAVRGLRSGLFLLPVAFLCVFFVYPLAAILDVSLRPAGQVEWRVFGLIFSSAYYRGVIGFTVMQALLSTLLTVGLALPVAWVFVRFRFPGKAFFSAAVSVPFVLPTVVVAAAFSAWIGEDGLVNRALMALLGLTDAPLRLGDHPVAFIIAAHVFYNYAVALRIISGYWANRGLELEQTAQVLGCSGWRMWVYIRLPLLRPAILAAGLLVFIFTFTSFGVVLLLGNLRVATLEVEIYYQAVNAFNLPVAGALSLLQVVSMLIVMTVYTHLERQPVMPLQAAQVSMRSPVGWREWGIVGLTLTGLAAFLMSPLMALALQSVLDRDGQFTLRYYQLLDDNVRQSILFVPPIEAVYNSLRFAAITTVWALFLGILAAYALRGRQRRWLDVLFMLPLATSAVTLGFGFLIALDRPPLDLRSSPWIVPIAHTLVALPFVIRSILPALRGIPPELLEVARVLGAPPVQVWRWIEWPLIRRSLLVGASFAFAVSMGEFGASLFVARPDSTPTIPMVIFRLLSLPVGTNYGQALALSVILMVICGVSFIVIEWLNPQGIF